MWANTIFLSFLFIFFLRVLGVLFLSNFFKIYLRLQVRYHCFLNQVWSQKGVQKGTERAARRGGWGAPAWNGTSSWISEYRWAYIARWYDAKRPGHVCGPSDAGHWSGRDPCCRRRQKKGRLRLLRWSEREASAVQQVQSCALLSRGSPASALVWIKKILTFIFGLKNKNIQRQ